MVSKQMSEVLRKYSGLLHRYQDRYIADSSLSNPDLLLLSIYVIDEVNKCSGADYKKVKDLFLSFGRSVNNFDVAQHRVKKRQIDVINEKFYLKAEGLKKIQELLGLIEKSPVKIIKSGENFSSIKLFEEFLLSEIKKGDILLCDPYISPETLFPFSVLKGRINSIRILTSNIHDSTKFNSYQKKFKKETSISVELKINKKIHDRYLIAMNRCWSIGTSIKDFGNKDTMIREISGVSKSIHELFDDRWHEV